MKGFASRAALAAGTLAAFLWLPPTSRAVTPLDSVSASPDVTVELASAPFDDEDVAVDDLLGVVAPASLGTLPANADLTAYHLLANGDQLFSLDTTVELAGSLTVEPGDVVRYDGVSYTLEFDASAEGVPNGVITDAVSVAGSGDLLLSFDTTVDLGAVTADDEDLVEFDGASFSLSFDGSAAGVPAALDLDAAHRLFDGTLGLSFDGSGQLGGVDFDDEDVLGYDPSGPTWSLLYDGSAQHSEWEGGPDLDAVALPEPGLLLSLGSGIGFLALLGWKRRNARTMIFRGAA
jgi:hypothetical protein